MELNQTQESKLKDEIIKGNPNVIKPIGNFNVEIYDLIRVEHGYDVHSNYIWHFSSKTDKRCLSSSNKFLGEVIYTYFHPYIPSDCEVEVFFPNQSFDIKILTVKGHGLGKKWNFDEKEVNEELPIVCKRLSDSLQVPRAWSHMARKR